MKIFKNNKLWNILIQRYNRTHDVWNVLNNIEKDYAFNVLYQLGVIDSLCRQGDYTIKELVITENINPSIYQYLQEEIIEQGLSFETKIVCNPIKGIKYIFEFVNPKTGSRIK